MRKIVLTIFLILFIKYLYGEKSDTTSYEFKLYGLSFSQQKISFLSPLYYDGVAIIESNGKTKIIDNKIKSSETDLRLQVNYNDHQKYIYGTGLDYLYNQLYHLNLKNFLNTPINCYLGGGYWLDSDFHFKPENTNNHIYYNFNNSICLGFGIKYSYKLLHFFNKLDLSVFSIYSTSEYGSSFPYFIKEKNDCFINAFDFGINVPIMKNKLNCDIKIKSKMGYRTLRIQYAIEAGTWEFKNNFKRYTFHIIKIGYLFNEVSYVH